MIVQARNPAKIARERSLAVREANGTLKRGPTLFPMREDRRVESQRTAKGRYEEPTLLDWLKEQG